MSSISHPAVVEAGVVGVPDELRGEVASALVVLAKGYQPGDLLRQELINYVKKIDRRYCCHAGRQIRQYASQDEKRQDYAAGDQSAPHRPRDGGYFHT